MSSWILLNDYSNKHRVSVSTLRRRIKAQKIEYKLEEGKYFILDEEQDQEGVMPMAYSGAVASLDEISMNKLMLEELKKAYLDSLQSKEDQILYLKQQVSDLKTLVLLLEKENAKLQGGDIR